MKLFYKKLPLLLIAGLVYLAGQYFRGVWFEHFFLNICRNSSDAYGTFCNSLYIVNLGFPFIALGQILAIVWVILLLADERTYRKWLKFSLFYIPIAAVLSLIIYPIRFAPGTPVLPVTYGIYPFGYLYILLTGIVVLLGWWRARKQSSQT